MITNPVELLPCPFCGGTAQADNLYDNEHFGISCTQCGAEIDNDDDKTIEQAAARWNRRVGKTEEKTVKAEPSNICHVCAEMNYTEDCIVNELTEPECTVDNPEVKPTIFGAWKDERGNWCWKFDVDVETGKIIGWPSGMTARTYYKVVDGFYAKFNDKSYGPNYVPDCFSLDDEGYGDYMYLTVSEDGFIKDWDKAKFAEFVKEME